MEWRRHIALSSIVIEELSRHIGMDSGLLERYWRALREACLVPHGKRGPTGSSPDIGIPEMVRLLLAVFANETIPVTAASVVRLGAMSRVSDEAAEFHGTFFDRLVNLAERLDSCQRIYSDSPLLRHVCSEYNITDGRAHGTTLVSIALIKTASSIAYAEIGLYNGNGHSNGGLYAISHREVYAHPGTIVNVDTIASTAIFERAVRVCGSVLSIFRLLADDSKITT
ncbi:MAG: hypothetical protein FD149_2721 [Rhodospirillaceae bacterium]|nr:MAG: hypothetical protein FD149_2721 [Rhodospirillaceae bacterium]